MYILLCLDTVINTEKEGKFMVKMLKLMCGLDVTIKRMFECFLSCSKNFENMSVSFILSKGDMMPAVSKCNLQTRPNNTKESIKEIIKKFSLGLLNFARFWRVGGGR